MLQIERLTKMRDLVEQHAAELERDTPPVDLPKFDLALWGCAVNSRPKMDCGTQACAIGLACLSDAFAGEGFTYRADGMGLIPVLIGPHCHEVETGWNAVEEFFGISPLTARKLFGKDWYSNGPTDGPLAARRVASRITRLLNGGKL